MNRLSSTLALCAVALAGPAFAGDLFDSTFAKVDGGKPCYARIYDAAHLNAHPRQTVRGMEIDFTPENPDGVRNVAAKFELGFGFRLKAYKAWFGDAAYCTTKGDGFDCYLDADGGLFRLTPAAGALRLDVVNRGGTTRAEDQIALEGETDSVGFGKPDGDDLHFVLARADRKLCDAANAQ